MMDQSGHTSIDTQRLRDLPLSSCKIEQPVPPGILRSRAPCAPAASICGNRYHYPCCVECQSGHKDKLTGNGPNRCSHPELLQRGDRHRMDEQFPDVGGHLDRENPAIIVAEPAAHGFSIGNMKVGGSVILVENLVPAILDLDAMATKNWTEEIHFEDMRTHAPKIKEAVTPGLDVQEGSNQKSYEYQRQRGRGFAAKRELQC